MADHKPNDLAYGAVGHPSYTPVNQNWIFEGSRIPSAVLKCVQVPSSPAVAARTSDLRIPKDVPSKRRARQIRALVEAFPEVAPARDVLPELARISEATIDSASCHDPAKGKLVVIVSVADERLNRPTSLAIFASGPSGCDLSLGQVVVQRQGWVEPQDFWLDVPVFGQDVRVWKGTGSAIQSITSAEPFGQGGSLVAVRFLAKTLVFKPQVRRSATRTGSRIDENLVAEISISDSGGAVHIDVALNPWDTRQFAILDSSGGWSIWTLPSRYSRSGTHHSRRVPNIHTKLGKSKLNLDTWARITWVCDPSLLAVCSRRSLELCNVGIPHSEPVGIELELHNSSYLILDLHLIASIPQYLCVLTSTHVWLLKVVRGIAYTFEVRRVASIRHYKDFEDVSLRLHLVPHGSDILVLVGSRMDAITVSYRLQFDGDTVIVHQPSEGDLASGTLHQRSLRPSQDLAFVPTQLSQQQNSSGGMDGTKFYTIFALDQTFVVGQGLYAVVSGNRHASKVLSPMWKQDLPDVAKGADRVSSTGHDDDHVGEDSHSALIQPRSLFTRRRAAQATAVAADYKTISYGHTYSLLNSIDSERLPPFQEVIEQAQTLLPNGPVSPMRTVRELVHSEINDPVLTNMTGCLEKLNIVPLRLSNVDTDHRDIQQPVSCRSLPLASMYGLSYSNATEGSNIWIRNLLNDSQAHVRLESLTNAKRLVLEKLGRQMAAEITLAGLVMRREEPPQEQPVDIDSRVHDWNLPLRSANVDVATIAGADTELWSQRRSPGGPTQSGTSSGPRSTTTGSSYTEASVATEVNRLSRYTTFSQDKLPPGLPRRLNRVLGHWVTSSDPSTYDWRSTNRKVSQQDDQLSDDDMTERDRRRLQRKAERSLRRQRREAEESLRQQRLSSHAPEILSASQPQPSSSSLRALSQQVSAGIASQPTFGSSQPSGFSQMPASQVLPGRHGGRPASKKRRRSGF